MKSGSMVTGSSSSLDMRKKGNEGEEDIFSKLPEFVVGHILSLLPTKDAVRTSVLSKSWVSRWTFVNKLDLDDSVFYSPKKKTCGEQCFIDFVNRALLLTKSSSLDSFSLVIGNEYDACLFITWMTSILKRNVKNLRISSHFDFRLPFPPLTSRLLFESKLLEELEIKICSCAIRVPPVHVHFGCLKLLKLSGIIFTIESYVKLMCLRLPVLKKFETKNCVWLNAKCVNLEAPLLESVHIEHDSKSALQELLSFGIKISALHLAEFTYCGYGLWQPIVLSDPSVAHNASANIIIDQPVIGPTGYRAIMLLKQFSQVKHLKFDGSQVSTLKGVAGLPVFGMLSHLELGLVTAAVLLGLLLKSPVLETLHFKGIFCFEQELLNSAVVPGCLGTTLRVVKFDNVSGLEHELCLAKFLMENGGVLERMSFSLESEWLGKSKMIEEFKKKLFSFKKPFSLAIVEFSND
ncbi:F-box/LRR-repeat protein At4g14103-like isoform X1 [Lotus japonicus]|uniref:F-box/LRR-repeat protein At4g14103-like isoform X1 n=1 Tax=Lotus japonicus TaxID=34305 RepID=UPI00258CAAB4|nr:F-box/LRR-repeat protein At4g14103-like isoform X1 [Lotus japonicus]XP_057438927.1 F-box/LRR-repeat protein At4g14103-like isoform X1 [Lotus japonicus]XP_057438928.1 F-box/LRR-repeat protein At4g14103-like isoform X1 [Lotus japonicus]